MSTATLEFTPLRRHNEETLSLMKENPSLKTLIIKMGYRFSSEASEFIRVLTEINEIPTIEHVEVRVWDGEEFSGFAIGGIGENPLGHKRKFRDNLVVEIISETTVSLYDLILPNLSLRISSTPNELMRGGSEAIHVRGVKGLANLVTNAGMFRTELAEVQSKRIEVVSAELILRNWIWGELHISSPRICTELVLRRKEEGFSLVLKKDCVISHLRRVPKQIKVFTENCSALFLVPTYPTYFLDRAFTVKLACRENSFGVSVSPRINGRDVYFPALAYSPDTSKPSIVKSWLKSLKICKGPWYVTTTPTQISIWRQILVNRCKKGLLNEV